MKRINRRTFLKSMAATSMLSAWGTGAKGSAALKTGFFGVHPFIEENPDAVFIMRTSVDDKHNSTAKYKAGTAFGTSVFITKNEGDDAFPVTFDIAMKPNLTARGKWQAGYTIERSMGIVTDAFFVEGVIESMKTLGLAGEQFHLREVNAPEDLQEDGYVAVAERTGADVRVIHTNVQDLGAEYVVWKDVEQGVWFKRIPYLWPMNAPNTFLINIAKLKAHGMGMTLSAKNLQGTNAANFQQHCSTYDSDMSIDYQNVHESAKETIKANYDRHVAQGIPRWDKPGQRGGIWQETWATRCLDNNSTIKPHLHVIEGIYGHDGNFIQGPHNDYAQDFLTNVIIFGKNPFHVDIIGTWLAGHEPGNFGLFHLAIERGLSTLLNPAEIPLYEWFADGSAVQTPLEQFERTPLKTYYLQRDYNGQTEPLWHLCDEPYDYNAVAVEKKPNTIATRFDLSQNYPNPFNASTSIRFSLPIHGHVRLEIINMNGQIVAVPADGFFSAGVHHIVWNADRFPSGNYLYRCLFNGYTKSGRMVLIK